MKRIPTVDELSNIIDTAKLAVEQSEFGPMFVYPDPSNPTKKQTGPIALALFQLIVTSIITKIEFNDTKGKEVIGGDTKIGG